MWFKGLAESFIALKRQTIKAGRLTKLHVFKGFVKQNVHAVSLLRGGGPYFLRKS